MEMLRSFYIVSIIFLFLVVLPFPIAGQTYNYQVGSAATSIEPDNHIISLSLAGYGGPRDGRFSLKWEKIGNSGIQVDDITFTNDGLFAIIAGEVIKINKKGNLERSPFRNKLSIKLLTSDQKQLFGLGKRNEVFVAKSKTRMIWKPAGFKLAVDNPVAMVKDGAKFFIADQDGLVWEAKPYGQDYALKKIAFKPGIIDLIIHAGRLYALTDSEVLYLEPDGKWLRKAFRNGKNLSEEIKLLAVKGDLIYGFDKLGHFYKAAQYSEDNLTAAAVSIKKGNDRVLIVSLDVCGVDADFVKKVKIELAKKFQLNKQAVLINSSHTHYAPVTQSWKTWGEHCQRPDSLYLYSIVNRAILKVAQVAIKNEEPANLYFARDTVSIGRNRNLPGDNLPYDNAVDVIKIAYQNQAYSDVMFLAGCHPVFNANELEFFKLSANYPAAARELLLKRTEIRHPIFLQGCGGDINPIDVDYKITGRKIANSVKALLEKDNLQKIHGKIDFVIDTIDFPTKPWSKEELLALKFEKEKLLGDIYAEQRVRWADLMLNHYKNGSMPNKMPVYIQTLNIGNWKLVGMSRETTTEYSLAVKKLWPNKMVTVAGYCNDVSSYLPTSRHIKTKVYEGDDSFFWYGQPSTFPENVHEVIIQSIKQKNR